VSLDDDLRMRLPRVRGGMPEAETERGFGSLGEHVEYRSLPRSEVAGRTVTESPRRRRLLSAAFRWKPQPERSLSRRRPSSVSTTTRLPAALLKAWRTTQPRWSLPAAADRSTTPSGAGRLAVRWNDRSFWRGVCRSDGWHWWSARGGLGGGTPRCLRAVGPRRCGYRDLRPRYPARMPVSRWAFRCPDLSGRRRGVSPLPVSERRRTDRRLALRW
jgi:hypothetical protein